jgi:hypothetical protein
MTRHGFEIIPNCPHCNRPAELVTGRTIYPHRRDLFEKWFWRCVPCRAQVGHASAGTTNELGRPSNKELRDAKMAAHAAFDPIWKSKSMSRKEAYQWLADVLATTRSVHIGESDVETCKRVIELCLLHHERQGRAQSGSAL